MTQDLRLSLKYQTCKINKLEQNISKVSFIEEYLWLRNSNFPFKVCKEYFLE